MKKDEVVTTLRISKDLHEQIRRIAKEKRRSLNSQIVYILLDWLSIDTDHVILKRLIETSTGFVTADEMIADYEKNKERNG